MSDRTLVQIQLRKKGSNAAENCVFMAQHEFDDCRGTVFKEWLEVTLDALHKEYAFIDQNEYHYVVCQEDAPMFLGTKEEEQ